ncbi:MAG: ATP synthase F0 subunit B [Terriglobia bacterium]
MNETFKLLHQLFVSSIPTLVLFLILLAVLERLFFRPVANVMKERSAKTEGALAQAREQAGAAEAKSTEYENALFAARQEIYGRRLEEKHKAQSEREDALRSARERAEGLVKSAQATLAAEVSASRQQLSVSSKALAEDIANRILSGGIPSGNGSAAF